MKFQIKLLTMAVAIAASTSSFASATTPGGDLGTLTQFPSQFGAYRSSDEGRLAQPGDLPFAHEYYFTLGTTATVIGSVSNFIFGDTVLSSVSVVSTDVDGNAVGTPITTSFADLSDVSFSFAGLAAGTYSLKVQGVFPLGFQAYSGSVYATAPVPEPESLALLLAGLGVAGVMVRRRHKA